MVYHKILNIALSARTLLFIHPMYNSIHLLIPGTFEQIRWVGRWTKVERFGMHFESRAKGW